jgi:dTDP-4-amino-4,6-dideoxygalactose transaminase
MVRPTPVEPVTKVRDVIAPSWVVPLSDVVGDDELVAAVSDVVRSGWWSSGPRVAAFEEQLAGHTGARHAIALANGTAALHLSLLAAGVGPGDEVITPSLTFVAAANAIRMTGATPVFCDILGDDDLNLDPSDVEAAIGPRTRAVVVLHYGGFPCRVDEVLASTSGREILVLEDAAHAIGASHRGVACGRHGSVGCFSFFSNKNVPIGEGGAVVTDDDDLAARIRLHRSHGMTTLTWDRHRGHASVYDVVDVGFNFRLDEIRAAMASVQLARLEAANEARRRIADRYVELLEGCRGLRLAFADRPDRGTAAHHLAVAILPAGADRTRIRETLAARGVQTSVHYPPVHRFSAYAQLGSRPLPRTESVSERILTLPLYPHLADEQVDLVAAALLDAVRGTPATLKRGAVRADDVSMALTHTAPDSPAAAEPRA